MASGLLGITLRGMAPRKSRNSGTLHGSRLTESPKQCLSDTVEHVSLLQPNFFAHLCLRIVNSDPEHGKALLQLLCPSDCPISGRELRFQSTIYFERITVIGQFRSSSDHSFLLSLERIEPLA